VLQRCVGNVRLPCNLSSSHTRLTCCLLDWTDSLDDLRRIRLSTLLADIDADFVLAADVVYDPSIIPALVSTLHLAITVPNRARENRPRTALIALTVRNVETVSKFIRTCEGVMTVEEIDAEVGQKNMFIRSNATEDVNEKQVVKIFQMSLGVFSKTVS